MKNKKLALLIVVIAIQLIIIGILLIFVLDNGKKVTISFNTNSEVKLKNIKVDKGEKVNLPVPEREGYEFLGWYIDDKEIDNTYQFDKTSILNAKWKEKVKYTVTFDTCTSNEKVPSQIVEEGGYATRPKDPEYSGSIFGGWYSNDKEFDFTTAITSDITLYAFWSYEDRTGKWGCNSRGQFGSSSGLGDGKPIIYLYPEKEMDVEVKLGNISDVTTIYPKYNNSWNVRAYPDGTLINKETGRSLYSLYWEGKNYPGKVTNEGFVIKGSDTSDFLEEKLEILGLNEREAEEFIIYWLPQMEHNNYNYIKFTERNVIDSYMPLEITPKPDTVIRIMMEFMPLEEKIEVKKQKLEKAERVGFTVIEWGGSNLSQKIVR